MDNDSLLDRLVIHVKDFQEGFQILSKCRTLEDLAKNFSHMLRGSLLVSYVNLFSYTENENKLIVLSQQKKHSDEFLKCLKESENCSIYELSDNEVYIAAVLKTPDNNRLIITSGQKLDHTAFNDFDRLLLHLFIQLLDNSYQTYILQGKEKQLNFSLNHRLLQLNNLIDIIIDLSKLSNSSNLLQLAIERAAVITNSSLGSVKVLENKEVKDKVFFPYPFEEASKEASKEENSKGYIIQSGFIFNKKEYQFRLFEKESRQGTIPFDATDSLLLEAISRQVRAALENEYLHKEQLEKQRIEYDLSIAASIQKMIIPKELPEIGGYEISGINIPSKSVGGDYFDCIKLQDGRFALIMADVAGKGVPASLLVNSLYSSLRAYLENKLSLTELAVKLNKHIFSCSTLDKYITILIVLLDAESGKAECLNAGHNPALIVKNDGTLGKINAGSIAIGMLEDYAFFSSETIELKPGELLLLYTDGITEAMNEEEDLYSDEALETFILENRHKSTEEIKDLLVQDVKRFAGSYPQSDDITLLCLRRNS